MKKLYHILVTLICILMGLIYGVTTQRHHNTSDRLSVVCTTTMITDAVKNIVGQKAHVIGLMGPGVDPHLYRATESDMHALSSADLIFYNGLHLEGKMAEILSRMNRYVSAVALADAISQEQLIASEFENIYDPHVWHDVQLWILMVKNITYQLMQCDPEHADYYAANADRYVAQLNELDAYVRECAQRSPIKIIITAHDAFAYFGRAYGFEVIGLQGISTEAQISTHDITNLVEIIIKHKIPAIFLESSIPSRAIQAVQQAVQAQGHQLAIAPELFSDALSDSSCEADTYHGMIKHNIDTMITALSG